MESSPMFYKNVLDHLQEGVYFVDGGNTITYWNKGAEQITGYLSQEVIGRKCAHNILMHVDAKGQKICETGCPLFETIKDGQPREREVFLLHKEGHRLPIVVRALPYYNDQGQRIGAVEIFFDNTKQKQQEEKMKQLAKLAFNDEITGTTNRRYGEMKLSGLMEEVRAQGVEAGLLAIELGQIKNDSLLRGSQLDDDTMKIIAKTLMSNLQEGDTVSRWDSNTFLLQLRNNRKSTLLLLGDKLRSLISQCKLTSNFKGDKLYTAIGGTCLKKLDNAQGAIERALQNARISLELQNGKIEIDA